MGRKSHCRCANQYAKPIFMCRKCVGHFLNVRTYYHALEHSETDGMNCKSILTSQDKVEIVKATYAYIVGENGLWSKGYCSSCYTKPLTHESKLTTTTNNFFALAEAVLDCFDEHPNASEPLDVRESSSACTACRADYVALNHFYRWQELIDNLTVTKETFQGGDLSGAVPAGAVLYFSVLWMLIIYLGL